MHMSLTRAHAYKKNNVRTRSALCLVLWTGGVGIGEPETPRDTLQGRDAADREGDCAPLPQVPAKCEGYHTAEHLTS